MVWITITNSSNTDQEQQNINLDLDPNHLTSEGYFEKDHFKKSQGT